MHDTVVYENTPERPRNILGNAQRLRGTVLLDVDAQVKMVAKIPRRLKGVQQAGKRRRSVLGYDADIDAGPMPV